MKKLATRISASLLILGVISAAASWSINMPSKEILGTWSAPDYGQVMRINRLRAEVYRKTAASCFREYVFPAHLGLVKIMAGASIKHRDDILEVSVDGAVEPIRHTRSEFPTECVDTDHKERGARHTFDVFWSAMAEHYPFFDLHNVDWDTRKELAPLSDDISEVQLASLLKQAMHGLNDGHVQLSMGDQGYFSPEEDPSWLRPNPSLTRKLLWQTALNQAEIPIQGLEGFSVRYGLRSDGLGYVAIKEMEVRTPFGQSSHEAASRAFQQVALDLQDAKGIVVDVRYNPGGSDSVAVALAEYFLLTPVTAFSKSSWQRESFSEPFQVTVHPADGPNLAQPVVVLISDMTGSAAEIFTLIMRERPETTIMGTRSSGGLSDVLEFTLPNGWLLGLSFQKYLSTQGEMFEGIGIPPDIFVEFDADSIIGGTDSLVEAAVHLLGSN
ncbi:S41 family peptidase [Ruegeria sp. EL01]|uniref:S41 family peptidase n=1 Tax=Ruegeria sp. EL01 TaxID=2107578 RepID=UPI000EA82169|nr:S41 family peptidase [Ruegeria sp. EL01]